MGTGALLYLPLALLVFLSVLFVYALSENLQVMGRWLERPHLLSFLLSTGAAAVAVVLAASVQRRRDGQPFYMGALAFAATFGTFAITFWPFMIPFSITVGQAAAPHTSLALLFKGEGLFVLPPMLIYMAITYRVFRSVGLVHYG